MVLRTCVRAMLTTGRGVGKVGEGKGLAVSCVGKR